MKFPSEPIFLDQAQVKFCRTQAKLVLAQAARQGTELAKFWDKDALKTQIQGLCGELAASQHLQVPFVTKEGFQPHDLRLNDGRTVDVKCVAEGKGLAVDQARSLDPCHIYVLVWYHLGSIFRRWHLTVRGWKFGVHLFRPKNLVDGPQGPFYLVHEHKLERGRLFDARYTIQD